MIKITISFRLGLIDLILNNLLSEAHSSLMRCSPQAVIYDFNDAHLDNEEHIVMLSFESVCQAHSNSIS